MGKRADRRPRTLKVDETSTHYLKWKEMGWERDINFIQLFYKRNRWKYDYQTNSLHTCIKDLIKCTSIWQNYGWVQSKEDFWKSIPYAVQILAPKGVYNFYINLDTLNNNWVSYTDPTETNIDLYIWEHYWRRSQL
jgi:hypothetical protein